MKLLQKFPGEAGKRIEAMSGINEANVSIERQQGGDELQRSWTVDMHHRKFFEKVVYLCVTDGSRRANFTDG